MQLQEQTECVRCRFAGHELLMDCYATNTVGNKRSTTVWFDSSKIFGKKLGILSEMIGSVEPHLQILLSRPILE